MKSRVEPDVIIEYHSHVTAKGKRKIAEQSCEPIKSSDFRCVLISNLGFVLVQGSPSFLLTSPTFQSGIKLAAPRVIFIRKPILKNIAVDQEIR